MRFRPFKGTAKEIAEQFKKDLYEAKGHLKHLEPFSEVDMWISKGLYQIVAAYYGADLCLYSSGVATIQGIKVSKTLVGFEDGCLMFELFACKDGGHFPTKNGVYMYKESEDTE